MDFPDFADYRFCVLAFEWRPEAENRIAADEDVPAR